MGQESKMQYSSWVANTKDKSEARLRASGTQDGCLRAGRCLGLYGKGFKDFLFNAAGDSIPSMVPAGLVNQLW